MYNEKPYKNKKRITRQTSSSFVVESRSYLCWEICNTTISAPKWRRNLQTFWDVLFILEVLSFYIVSYYRYLMSLFRHVVHIPMSMSISICTYVHMFTCAYVHIFTSVSESIDADTNMDMDTGTDTDMDIWTYGQGQVAVLQNVTI